ncbi:vacuolar protein sorting-associated protein VTA1 homolog [Planococcus citri]|uniref:vacuolar protein sorting-associated protein VTA1 homolog n=1 Tax=Planococcus citri TaxID=170843 RepID=UPI0031F7A8AB
MTVQLPPCPESLRNVQPYLKVALEHDERNPVISYWSRIYALQLALTIDKKSTEAKQFLLPLMDWLEKTKRSSANNELITSEAAAQAFVENYALKLFIWADNNDRGGIFNKNVVRSFYTSGLLMDVLTTFGELSEEITKNRKYAKWKAAYINNCMKTGEVPIPGPQGETDEEQELNNLLNLDKPASPPAAGPAPSQSQQPSFPSIPNSSTTAFSDLPTVPSELNLPNTNFSYNPHPTPSTGSPQPSINSASNISTTTQASNSSLKLDSSQITKAQKFCKFASSALNYDDIPEAINNLQKALKLLQTGEDE